jgi:FMN phosphatase YigB (HAD superfamily)
LIRALLFDYGDTLVVTKKRGAEIISLATRESFRVFKRHGLRMSYTEFVGHDKDIFERYTELEMSQEKDIPDLVKNRELVDVLLPEVGSAKKERIASEANDAFWNCVARCYSLRMGAKASLRRFKKAGIRMAVISNHHNAGALRGHLKAIGISPYFSQVIVSSELSYRKPDPRIFRRGTTLLGVKPNQSAFVGDSLTSDMAGAKRVGMLTIWVREPSVGHSGRAPIVEPDYGIQDLKEIPRIIASVNHSQM